MFVRTRTVCNFFFKFNVCYDHLFTTVRSGVMNIKNCIYTDFAFALISVD